MLNKSDCNLSTVLKLGELLRPDFNAVQEKISDGIALFGAGQFGRASLEYLRKNNFTVICFIDNAPEKQGTIVDGIPVVPTGDSLVTSAGVTLITARHAVGHIQVSLQANMPKLSFDAWFLLANLQKYIDMRDQLFPDSRSKECLDGIMLTMLTGDENWCASVMDFNQYFCLPQFVNIGTDVFVDAGAYVGDTVEKFIWANNGGFKHIYAFEPCGLQIAALQHRRERLIKEWALNENNFTIINAGLGQFDSFANINIDKDHLLGACLSMSVPGVSDADVKVVALDNYINGKAVTFIKADIEGMEMAMLKGSINTIKANTPKMALSVYHKPDDLLEIIQFIRAANMNYTFALRNHSPLLMDTTLYCWQN